MAALQPVDIDQGSVCVQSSHFRKSWQYLAVRAATKPGGTERATVLSESVSKPAAARSTAKGGEISSSSRCELTRTCPHMAS